MRKLDLSQRLQQAKAENLWLLAGLWLAFMPHFFRLSLLIILPSAILLGWRLMFELRYLPLPSRTLRWLLTLVAIGATYVTFNTLIGRQAGVGLLVIMLCLKLMEMNSQRDVGVVIGLGFFTVVTVFLFDQSIFMGAYMLLVVTLLVIALIAFSRDRSSATQWANIKKATVLLAQAAPLALLLFVLFPRIPGPLWNLPSDAAGAATGLSDSMSPGMISQLSDDDSVAFRVQFDTPLPAAQKRYWRGPVFTQFDGKSWGKPFKSASKNSITMDSDFRVSGEPSLYTVTLEPHQQRWLFALDLPVQIPPDSSLSADYELLSRQPVQQLTRYAMRSFTDYQLARDDYPKVSTYLQLPASTGQQARKLAQQLWQGSNDNAAYVQSVLDHFAQQPFYYTRQPPLMLQNPVDQFLFDNRRGFCEHYASAFVFLMRAAGVPARVVTGYQGGEMNPQSDYFIVRQSDAHAWAEVWLRGQGWRRVDPTAVIPPQRIEHQQDRARIRPGLAQAAASAHWLKNIGRQLGFGWDRFNHAWNQWVVNYNSTRQQNFLSRLLAGAGMGRIDWREMVSLLVAGMTLVLLATGVYLLRPWQKQKIDPAQQAYEQFCRRLSRRGLLREPSEGPLDFAHRAAKHYPQRSREIGNITALYQRQRYAPFPTQSNLQQLQAAVRRFRA
jgi:protein-glutamine gamma-glutamyltransferase